jgi:peptidoglycan/xylan/chitin deacetylase (PgdA/CDA1 family)
VKVSHRLAMHLQVDTYRLRNAGPMVSFTFDDLPKSAATTGADILEAHGAHGTFYVSGGLVGVTTPEWAAGDASDLLSLRRRGHEIGCHTFSHLDCGQAPAGLAAGDVERNLEALRALGAPEPRTFAYPYGDVSTPAKAALGSRFSLLRALHHGLIDRGSDLNQAPAVGIEGPPGEQAARGWLRRALAQRAWLILYTHDVREDPSPFGCTPAALARLLDEALAGGAEIVTVAEGCRRVGVV